ncbi:MAG: YbjQ family protein [Candidatus Altiarchaeota archaeon]
MILATTPDIKGKEIAEVLGIVRGSTVRAKWLGKDILAGLRNLVGGEMVEYTEMLAEAREQALNRMMEDASKIGADGVVQVRFATSQIMRNAAEMLAYGTAVKFKKK